MMSCVKLLKEFISSITKKIHAKKTLTFLVYRTYETAALMNSSLSSNIEIICAGTFNFILVFIRAFTYMLGFWVKES